MADLPIPYSECPVCESAEEHYLSCDYDGSCLTCGGSGKEPWGVGKCPACNGSGFNQKLLPRRVL